MRYFLEVSYKGTAYAGFQVQANAHTIQAEVENALATVLKAPISLTGSSRTDAGVHALQNYFHFNTDLPVDPGIVYNLNAILPRDVAVRSLRLVNESAHARFDAISREYKYFISAAKDPFHIDTAWFYPYKVNLDALNEAASVLFEYNNYESFAKRNTQVHTYQCTILKSVWQQQEGLLIYNVSANRFLRGMVRGLVGTMLLVGRGKMSVASFKNIIESADCTKANFATPAHGLFLVKVCYPEGFF